MKVITENDIRFFLRKHPEKKFRIEPTMFLTPSAKSYIREKKIVTESTAGSLKELDSAGMLNQEKEEMFVPLEDGTLTEIENLLREKMQEDSKEYSYFLSCWEHQLRKLQLLMEEICLLSDLKENHRCFYQRQLAQLANGEIEKQNMSELQKTCSDKERLLLQKILYQIEKMFFLIYEKLTSIELQRFTQTKKWLSFDQWQQQFREELKKGELLIEYDR